MVEGMKSSIIKLLQESMKLDRSGIRWGWCPKENKDTFIFKMEFTLDELKNGISPDRIAKLVELGERCTKETQ